MDQGIRRKLSRITNILWAGGVTNPVTYIEQISYLIYLKLLDEEEASRELRVRLKAGNGKRLFPDQAERFRWVKWRFYSGNKLRDFIRDEVFPYMASLVKDEPQVAEYFRDAVLEITDPNVLKQVVDELDTIDFRKMGPDVKGDIFEYLLTHLGQSALNGQFRTPRQIRAFMVAMTDPDIGDTVFDPACGTGGFLIDTVDYLLARYSETPQEVPIYGEDWLEKRNQTLDEAKNEIPSLQTFCKGAGERIPDWNLLEASIFGTDVSRQMMRISMMNLVLHGIGKAPLKRANVLSEMGGLTEDDLNRRYKVILSNPPFAGVLPKDSIRHDLPTSSKKSELLFLALLMESLAPGGRCAVVLPEGALFGASGAHKELRKKLVTDFEILAVVSLPAGVFKPYAGVKTSVLVFRKPVNLPENGNPATRKVWFYEIKNDGYDPDKIQGGVRPETPEKNEIPGLLKAWDDYKKFGFQTPPGKQAGAMLPPGSTEPKYWWAESEMIVTSDYNLTASRYKPQIAEEVPDEDPADLIREVLKIEQEITEGLEKLLKDVEEAG
ncbi:type I restriction-modification system subunit M [Desulfotignum phosphitoxidans]|jgi:type I restriction enzyme M protein|uniref:site-specific DNA-methyltransferase (adenine-specific) n=1 Tax=Desulfotignum phosphitoxidans DSM 13687 TaxID=1286635 RepID=S0FWF8_9BACT|nr:class I SAM-dependent DNA methyltransferase [Desulfotignum phosphitoxidans]EMS79055.1 type I restriction enzyme HindVIIP/EcoEI protein HsdM [Desulfotignum phosphitoxidans DSM 13687]